MADYIYLLETRLSPAQQGAIGTIRTIAREHDTTVFLTGGAVRDLTGGGSVRDLDLTVQGDVLRLKAALQAAGADLVGENTAAQRLFFSFPGGVRVELATAMSVTFPKPGQPHYEPGNLTDDLRSRDFTANAMAISLNEGSYGLLMDPLNGVADIENRELRLVNNYGFIEDPSRLIRAARLSSRLGWQMEERTRQRYDTAKEENYIQALSDWNRGYELEEVFHEEDPVRIMRSLEAEGWMTVLSPALSSTKANTAALSELAEKQGALQTHAILSQSAAIAFPLVTAKLTPAEAAAVKSQFARPGFAREIDTLENRSKDFATRLAAKDVAAPSSTWKLLHSSDPNLVLAVAYGSKVSAVQARLKTFLTESAGARQRIPYTLMQEMRISSDLPAYPELVERLFFELMDNKLSTTEEMKAFLEPYSPPAPPPPVNLRRARAKKEARPSRAKAKKGAAAPEDAATVAAEEEAVGVEDGLMEPGTLTGPDRGTEPTSVTPLVGKVAPEVVVVPASTKQQPKVKAAPAKQVSKTEKPVAAKVQVETSRPAPHAAKKAAPAKAVKAAPVTVAAAKKSPAKATPPAAPRKPVAPAKRAPAKAAPVKAVARKSATPTKSAPPAKKAAPAAKKAAPAKKAPPAKKAAAKKAARR